MAVTLTRRPVRSSPAVRAVLATPVLRHAIGAQRAARVLRPAVPFLAGEAGARRQGRYRIGRTEGIVHLRHGSRDVEILNEIFSPRQRSYEPPVPVARELELHEALHVGDLGGNIGLFGVFALERWRVEVLRSYEPDPGNAALLQATIVANDPVGRWTLVRAAVSNAQTTASFEAGLLSESRIAPAGARRAPSKARRFSGGARLAPTAAGTIEVPVLDLFAQPPCDLLKIDIEGAEWPILADPRLASYPATAIVLEWHRRMCPAPNPRIAARELLRRAGYRSIFEDAEQTATNGVMWGLRR